MLVSPRVTSFFLTGAFTKSTSGPSFETIVLPGMNEWMSTPEAGTTQGKKMTPKTARVETKDPQSTTVCLVDLPHSLLCQGVTLFILSPLPSFHLVYLSLVFTHAPRRLLQRTGNVVAVLRRRQRSRSWSRDRDRRDVMDRGRREDDRTRDYH